MQANERNLIALFDRPLRYVVPIFQRHYVWDAENQWGPLWEDVLEKLAQRRKNEPTHSHFLGAVILDAVRNKTTREMTRFLVIDGQQRITTVQLFLAALRDVATHYECAKVANAVGRTLFNPDPELMENRDVEIFKLWPTQFNRKVFCDILNAGSLKAVDIDLYPKIKIRRRRKYEPRDLLVEAYVFFYEKIRGYCGGEEGKDGAEDALLEIYGVLRDDFAVVEIILGEQDNSQEIFNSLNARGKPLSQSDLLRSFIFMRAEKGNEDRDRLFSQYWSLFEEPFWDQQIRRGNVWSSLLDWATRLFLSSKLGTAVDARKVHLEYMNWIRTSSPYQNIEDELKDFSAYGKRFRSLIQPPSDAPYTGFALRLKIWDVSTAYPLVLYLLEESGLSQSAHLRCLQLLESFVVRRLVCRKDNKEYNKYFPEIVGRLRAVGPTVENLTEILLSGAGATREWPDDAEFQEHWRSSPMYDALQTAQVATILKMIEAGSRTSRTEDIPIPAATVEHVMPKAWAQNYPLDGEIVPDGMSKDWFHSSDDALVGKWELIKLKVQARNKAIHCIGNLTLVTQPLNSSMQNAAFVDKQKHLRDSLLLLNRHFDPLCAWDEEAIGRRSIELFRTAKLLWPRS